MRRSLIYALILGVLASAAAAQASKRTEIRRVDAPGAPGYEVVVSRLVVPPGGLVHSHIHFGDEHMVVLEGATLTSLMEKTELRYASGDTAYFPRELVHRGFRNRGDTTLVAITTHFIEKGKPFSHELLE